MKIFERAKQNLSLKNFKHANNELFYDYFHTDDVPEDQYILRMMIKSPWTNGFVIPEELCWLKNQIELSHFFQRNRFVDHPFVYVTVRSGEVKSVADDEWHVDGFSMRTPHAPEQNYIWSNCNPTEVLDQSFEIPEDFDPFKHNIHQYFQDRAENQNIITLESNRMYVIDPYIVHRRPKIEPGVKRCFFRISYIPIEIEDDTCMRNPLLPEKKYHREDIRNKLIRY